MCGDNGGADRRPVESTAGIAHREGQHPIAGPGRGQVLRISFIALSTRPDASTRSARYPVIIGVCGRAG